MAGAFVSERHSPIGTPRSAALAHETRASTFHPLLPTLQSHKNNATYRRRLDVATSSPAHTQTTANNNIHRPHLDRATHRIAIIYTMAGVYTNPWVLCSAAFSVLAYISPQSLTPPTPGFQPDPSLGPPVTAAPTQPVSINTISNTITTVHYTTNSTPVIAGDGYAPAALFKSVGPIALICLISLIALIGLVALAHAADAYISKQLQCFTHAYGDLLNNHFLGQLENLRVKVLAAINNLGADISGLRSELAGSEDTIVELHRLLRARDEQIVDLEAAVCAQELEASFSNDRADTAEADVETLNATVSRLKDQLKASLATSTDAQKQINSLETSRSQQFSELVRLNAQLFRHRSAAKAAKTARLGADVQLLHAQIALRKSESEKQATQQNLETRNKILKTLKGAKVAAEQRAANAETSLKDLREDFEELEDANADLDEKLRKCEDRLDKTEDDLQDSEERLDSTADRLNSALENKNALTARQNDLIAGEATLIAQLDQAEAALLASRRIAKELREAADELRQKLKESRQECDALGEDNVTYITGEDEAKKALEKAQAELEELKTNKTALTARQTVLIAGEATLITQLDQAEAALLASRRTANELRQKLKDAQGKSADDGGHGNSGDGHGSGGNDEHDKHDEVGGPGEKNKALDAPGSAGGDSSSCGGFQNNGHGEIGNDGEGAGDNDEHDEVSGPGEENKALDTPGSLCGGSSSCDGSQNNGHGEMRGSGQTTQHGSGGDDDAAVGASADAGNAGIYRPGLQESMWAHSDDETDESSKQHTTQQTPHHHLGLSRPPTGPSSSKLNPQAPSWKSNLPASNDGSASGTPSGKRIHTRGLRKPPSERRSEAKRQAHENPESVPPYVSDFKKLPAAQQKWLRKLQKEARKIQAERAG